MKKWTLKIPDALHTELVKTGIAMGTDNLEDIVKAFIKLGCLAAKFENNPDAGLFFHDEAGMESKISLRRQNYG